MQHDALTSDSGFIVEESAPLSTSYVDITPLHSLPSTHSELYTATRMGKRFVLKALKAEYRGNELYRGLLRNEFNIGYHLSHPNIAQVISFEHIDGLGDTIIIEHIDGITLKEAVDANTIDKPKAIKIISELCDAMHYIHSLQVVHRDIKPENIMITHNGTNVKMIDFGLSCCDSQTLYKQPAGTRHYASPELLNGEKIDNRSDIYALGVIIPYIMHDRRALRISKRCLAENRSRRYSDTLSIKRELLRPRRWPIVLLILGVMLLIAASSYITYRYTSMQNSTEVNMIRSHEESITNTQNRTELFNDACTRIEQMANEEYSLYYAQYSRVTTKSELKAITPIDKKQLEIEKKALAILGEIVTEDDSEYTKYRYTIDAILDWTWQYNYNANIQIINEAIYRAQSSSEI